MFVFVSWMDYLIVTILAIVMVQVGMLIGASLEKRYGT